MTLRLRLVLALVLLATIGLGTFGVTTYALYRRSQERQLDEQLRSSAPAVGRVLAATAGPGTIDASDCADPLDVTTRGPGQGGPGRGPGFAPGQALDAYAELRNRGGDLLACFAPVASTGRPALPEDLGDQGRLFTTGSSVGSGGWRVLVVDAQGGGPPGGGPGGGVDAGTVVAVAVPTAGIDASMDRLLRIELTAALALLAALGVGAWLILRRSLRPLESMAASAATITDGDLSHRVSPADDHTEVGQLGLALNTMLDGIEVSFHERDATEQRLRQFLADASHELRTPLTSIQGFAELFRLAEADGPGGIDQLDLPIMLRRIEQESARMKALVEDLLLLARIDETRPFEPVPVDLAVLAADACTDAAAVSPDRRITLEAPVPVVVTGEADHLRQAIANLLTNAVKHTPDGTAIDVSARVVGQQAVVTVRDHGPGLATDALAHVFDRFWQADPSRTGAGSGLGLSIVAGIAEEHGGTATAATHPAGGATFTLTLPVSRGGA